VDKKEIRAWKTVSKRTILKQVKYLTVEMHTVRLPDGQIIPDWTWVIIPSAVNVLAVTEDNQFLCFRQTKYGLDGISLAPVGGMLEPDEAPLKAAKRELLEEMGYDAADWINLGSYVLEPNRGIATMHLFLALNAKQVSQPSSDDLEDQEIVMLNRAEIENALRSGDFKALAWTTVVALALDHLSATENKLM
jgi:ADP-ribose pyrophosphatase